MKITKEKLWQRMWMWRMLLVARDLKFEFEISNWGEKNDRKRGRIKEKIGRLSMWTDLRWNGEGGSACAVTAIGCCGIYHCDQRCRIV